MAQVNGIQNSRSDMRPINLTIVMATYNRADLLGKNINLLLSSGYAFELLVIDDGSTDCTEKTARSFNDPRISYRKHPSNYGYAKSLNDGIQHAKNSRILLCEDDVFISDPDVFIGILNSEMGEKRIIATHLLRNGIDKKPSILARFRRYFAEPLAKEVYNYTGNKRVTTKFCNNFFGFDRDEIKTRFDEVDYVGNSFRIESDFQFRARKEGAKIVYNPTLLADHIRHKRGGLRVSNSDEFLRQCMTNHITFLKKHFSSWNILCYIMLSLFAHPTKRNVIQKVLKSNIGNRGSPPSI
jgi:glycosyltransferase involved in cell wall biosynthesis